MSLEFWHKKLSNCFVKRGDSWTYIDDVQPKNKDADDPPRPRNAYPEDVVDRYRFHAGVSKLKLSDFSCEIPPDQYKMMSGKPVFGSRTMVRAYKISTDRTNFTTSAGGATLGRWLNTKPEYSQLSVDKLFDWGTNYVFTPLLAVVEKSETRRDLLLAESLVFSMHRNMTEEYMSKGSFGHMPMKYLAKQCPTLEFPIRRPYKWPKGKKPGIIFMTEEGHDAPTVLPRGVGGAYKSPATGLPDLRDYPAFARVNKYLAMRRNWTIVNNAEGYARCHKNWDIRFVVIDGVGNAMEVMLTDKVFLIQKQRQLDKKLEGVTPQSMLDLREMAEWYRVN